MRDIHLSLDSLEMAELQSSLAKLDSEVLFEFMVTLGYDIHHIFPVSAFDYSYAFREVYEFEGANEIMPYNAEKVNGLSPRDLMQNQIPALEKRVDPVTDALLFGVHDGHKQYNANLSRFLDLRFEEWVRIEEAEAHSEGELLSQRQLEEAARLRMLEELSSLAETLKIRIVERTIKASPEEAIQINDLFGKGLENLSKTDFMNVMKHFFEID